MLSDNSDTKPFSSKTIVDCHPISIELYSGSRPAERFPFVGGFLGSVQCARAGRLFEYRVES